MLFNVSYRNPKITNTINQTVGLPFTLKERFALKGIGSGKLYINSSSIEIHNLLVLDAYLNVCNIEIRPDGIILGFRSLLESYALIIPYYQLKIYKGKAEEYSIYGNKHFVKIKADSPRTHRFMKKILTLKADHSSSSNHGYY